MEKGKKVNLRRKCHREFTFDESISLYYRVAAAKLEDFTPEDGGNDWSVRADQGEKIIEPCHAGVGR